MENKYSEKEILLCALFMMVLCFIIDIRLGMIFSTVLFAIYIFYFVNNKDMFKNINNIRENYNDNVHCNGPFMNGYNANQTEIDVKYEKSKPPCMSENCRKLNTDPFRVKSVVVNEKMRSYNHELEQGQNPKTRVPPMVTRPMYDLDWRASTLIVPNKLNARTNENLSKSGYVIADSEPAGQTQAKFTMIKDRKMGVKYGEDITNRDIVEHFDGGDAFTSPYASATQYSKKDWQDYVDAPTGYDAKQWEVSRYPANLPQGPAGIDPNLRNYNENLFTQTVQPGVYYKDDVIEPVNHNIGISFQQQFLPRTFKEIENGVEIEDHDPRFAPEPERVPQPTPTPTAYNVYDPRTYGYGTSYRNYVDDVTGQPRFPYDDINSVRQPNYIVRSKIDTHNFADVYGPAQQGVGLNDVRDKAQDAFLRDSVSFRDDIMSKLMRKRNAELWQLRQYPKSRATTQRMLGGGGNAAPKSS